MKRRNGFSLIELMVAMVILLIITGAAIGALMQAENVTAAVGMQANTQQNLRAGMHELVRDLAQAGEGIPEAGISIPNNGATSAIARPGGLAGFFLTSYLALPPITPGNLLGEDAKTLNPANGTTVLDGGLKTDIVTILYEDNTLVSSALGPAGVPAPLLNQYPVTQAAPASPVCAGTIAASGLTVTLAPTCFKLPGGQTPLAVGDLIMFHNSLGTALEMITNINTGGNVLTFAAGDPAGLNQTGLAKGTVTQLNVAAIPTSISRVWMVTYYVDSNTTPSRPQLIRQVDYPGYPTAATATYPAQPVADIIENLSFSYDLVGSTAPAGTYPLGPGNAPQPQLPWDTPFNIRAVNVTLAGRSEYTYSATDNPQYFRNNLSTQVSIRSMAFVNSFPTPGNLP